MIAFEPNIHSACLNVAQVLPPFLSMGVWVLAFVWIVGVTNAMNLIDGIDGFAGGVSLLTAVTCIALHAISGGQIRSCQ